ncbi:MAG: AI-2E family transporter [Desulfovibrionales bacterium]|nr:AI-2E family transporter [Desulfovibrionales bacterium]
MHIVRQWLHTVFSDTQLVILFLVLVVCAAIILSVGDLLAPVIASVIIAFLLEGLVRVLEGFRWPRMLAVCLVFGMFMLFLAVLLFALIPLLASQITDLIDNIPWIISKAQNAMLHLPQQYPILTEAQMQAIVDSLTLQFSQYGQQILAFSLSSVRSVFSFVVYLVLMPIMVFFFLKDKKVILTWLGAFLPSDHNLASRVWTDVKIQAGNYVRGRIWEVLIVWGATYGCFLFFGLDYAMLLSLLVGLSVIIPYIGAVVVTVPVLIIAYIQWGMDSHFTWAMFAYFVVQLLDANVLVPLLLSGAVNLHPIASIMAILLFGGVWGFWGVFFAIPLASLAQAVLNAWRHSRLTSVAGQGAEPGTV